MRDIWIVCKKDLREALSARGGRRGFAIQIAVLAGMFGVLPLSQREAWMAGMLPAAFFAMIPLFLASGVVADSFAGERERKTLETLLASRLPDRAIFLGKVASALIYALLLTVLAMVSSLIALNLTQESGGPYLYPAAVILAGLLGACLVGLLVAGVGVFISLRAGSVREAQQTLVLPTWLLFMAVGFGLPALAEAVPETVRQGLIRRLAGIDPAAVGAGLLLILALVDAGLLSLAIRRFRRTRLILD